MTNLRIIAIIVALMTGFLTAVGLFSTNPGDLGLTVIQMRWLLIFNGTLGIAASFLPPVVKYGAEARESRRRKRAGIILPSPTDGEHNI